MDVESALRGDPITRNLRAVMPDDPRRARELFLHAVGKLSSERWDSFVEEACGGDVALEKELRSMLQVHRDAGSFLITPIGGPVNFGVAGSTVDQSLTRLGTHIGPYKLLQVIGEGGMGVVYMAEQTQPVQRKVALKVIKPGMDSGQVIARFEAERQALSMMDHVNIARVLDAGTTQQGRPYFVMELVHGVSITKYCDDNRLTPRQRLELFVPVCQAIQHAHQKGIIHRDIKPSNVMVTLYDGKPVAKVIDFGVAKATEQKLTGRTLFTQYGMMVGTLEYMSPEQAEMSALGVDTRSDIYSLGVLLYELLTGGTPLSRLKMKDVAYAEILRMIKEEEPPKPSTRLSESGQALASISAQRHMEPTKLTQSLRGELDWIVMKTLEKDRNRRYATANGFAADVLRYLNDETVLACPPSVVYSVQKFARRYKRSLATVTVLAITLLLGTVGSIWQAIRATRAEGLADQSNRSLRVAIATAEQSRQQMAEMAARMAWEKGRDFCNESKIGLGLLWMARALETLPQNSIADATAIREDIAGRFSQCHLLVYTLTHPQAVTVTSFSPDGRSLLTGCSDGVARVWNLESGRVRHQFLAHPKPITTVLFSPDGKTFLTSGKDGTARLWDSDSGYPKNVIKHPPEILSTAWCASRDLLCTGGKDGLVRSWNLAGQEVGEPFETTGPVQSLAFHPDGTVLAAAGWNTKTESGEVSFWNFAERMRSPLQLSATKSFLAIKFSPDGKYILTGDEDWEANLWNANTGVLLAKMLQDGKASSVDFSPDGLSLILGCEDTASASLIEIRKLKIRRSTIDTVINPVVPSNLLHRGPVLNVCFSPDGRSFVSAGNDRVARVWKRAVAIVPERQLRKSASISALTVDSNGQVAALADVNGDVCLWRFNDASQNQMRLVHSRRVNALSFTPNGSQLVTGSVDGMVRFWDVATGNRLDSDLNLESAAESLAISIDGNRLLVGCENGNVRQFDLASLKPIGSNLQNPSSVVCVAFDSSGRNFATGTNDGQLSLYSHGSELSSLVQHHLQHHRGRINGVSYNRSGSKVITGSADGTAVIWDRVTGNPLTTFACGREVTTAIFDQDEEFVLLGGYSGDAQLWSVATTKSVGIPFRHPNAVTRAVFCSENRRILTACWDGGVRLWQFPPSLTVQGASMSEFLQHQIGIRLSQSGVSELADSEN